MSDSCLSIHHMDPLQDPCLRVHLSAFLHLSILYKIHVFGFMSQQLRISGSSARSMSPDPCLRFMPSHPPIWILYKIHVFRFMSQHLCISGSSARSVSLDLCLSIRMYLRILCKVHVSGFMSQHPYVSQDLLQDPCLRVMSQHLYISGSSARSMSPDPCLRIHVSASSYLRILCKIHVFGSMSPIHVSTSTYPDPLHDPCIMYQYSCLGILKCGSSPRSVSQRPYLWKPALWCGGRVDGLPQTFGPPGRCKSDVVYRLRSRKKKFSASMPVLHKIGTTVGEVTRWKKR